MPYAKHMDIGNAQDSEGSGLCSWNSTNQSTSEPSVALAESLELLFSHLQCMKDPTELQPWAESYIIIIKLWRQLLVHVCAPGTQILRRTRASINQIETPCAQRIARQSQPLRSVIEVCVAQ